MSTEFSTELATLSGDSFGHRPSTTSVQGVSLKRMLRLRLPLILGVAIPLAVVSATAVWFAVPLEYTATAEIEFFMRPTGILREDTSFGNNTAYDKHVRTQVARIQGTDILGKVLEEPEIKNLPAILAEEDPLEFMRDAVNARAEAATELVRVTCTMREREDALLVLQHVVKKYLEEAERDTRNRGGVRQISLSQEADDLRLKLQEQRDLITEAQRNVPAPITNSGSMDIAAPDRQNLSDARAQLQTAQADHAQYIADLEALRSVLKQHLEAPNEKVSEYNVELGLLSSPVIAGLETQVNTMEQQLILLRANGHPTLKKREADLSAAKAAMERNKASMRRQVIEDLIATARKQINTAKAQVSASEKQIALFEEKVDQSEQLAIDVAQQMAEIQQMQNRADDIRERLDAADNELYTQRVESKAPASFREQSPPTVPVNPDLGKRFQIMFLAVAGSCMLGLGLGVWREFVDQEVRSAQDIGFETALPILATIPHASADRLPNGAEAPLLTADHPTSTTADEYRRILTRIIYPPEGSAELNTCLVASPSHGDGKTSLACNLAISLAKANRRVLLVDINPRRPQVESSFGLERGPGLSDILCDHEVASDMIRVTEFPNLCVLGPGFRGEELAPKLASRDTVEFLEKAEQSFDHVIIDSPSSLLMSDAKLLAPVVDGVVLVVGVSVSSRGMMRRCLSEMQQIGANVVGVVLNGVKPTRGGYLGRNLDMYYAGDEQTLEPSTPDDDLPEMKVQGDDGLEPEEVPAILLVEDTGHEVELDADTGFEEEEIPPRG
jgi:capsular exopolysaccharide synthesis family protein